MLQRTILGCILVMAGIAIAGPAPDGSQNPVPVVPQHGSDIDRTAPAAPAAPALDVNAAELAEDRDVPAAPAGNEASRATMAPVNPLAPRFHAVLAEERQQLEALNEEFARATDEETALDIQRRIRAVKIGTQRRLLEIQLEAARASGDEQRIATLEEAIASLDAPRPAPIHVERDVPDVHQH